MILDLSQWKKVRDLMAELAFPETEESTSYGTPAYKVQKNLLLRIKEDGETLVIHADDRDVWMTDDPEVFFVTEHYYNYPYVLVRLKKIRKPKLRQLIRQSWLELAPEKLRKRWEG